MSTINELKQEATELGLEVAEGVTAAKLKKQIDTYYDSQNTSQADITKAVESKSDSTVTSKEDAKIEKRNRRIANARKTKVITITDNDQRVNNNTTTCTVNCSNEFFDLGTAVLPLNEKIEVAVGHINTLKEVMIPLHTKDPKTGLSATRMRSRYSITEESV